MPRRGRRDAKHAGKTQLLLFSTFSASSAGFVRCNTSVSLRWQEVLTSKADLRFASKVEPAPSGQNIANRIVIASHGDALQNSRQNPNRYRLGLAAPGSTFHLAEHGSGYYHLSVLAFLIITRTAHFSRLGDGCRCRMGFTQHC
jgi:hypothetical protein